MSLEELYNWQAQIRAMIQDLGYWQSLVIAMYSLGMVLARQSAPSKVAEKLGVLGKPDTVQRRLERFVDNARINWQRGCVAWSRWVLSRYSGEHLILLVDETKLGPHLSVMMVGLAYRSCCVPLAWWAYDPKAWPMGQVALIDTLLSWVADAVAPGVIPLVQADRGIGTSPDLVRGVERLGWHYLFRVQKSVVLRHAGQERSLKHLVNAPGQTWSGTGQVFKKDGWLDATVLVVWAVGYTDFWCLLTNDPAAVSDHYAIRYWQEAGFRDLKSDGWQWQTSRIWSPDHANRLLLVMALATAWMLTLGAFVFDDADLKTYFTKGQRPTYSLFRLGLRFVDALFDHTAPVDWPPRPFISLSYPLPFPLCVGV
jgi:Transposase DDE domain